MDECHHFQLFIHDYGPEILKVLTIMGEEYEDKFGKTIQFKITDRDCFTENDMNMLEDTFANEDTNHIFAGKRINVDLSKAHKM